MATKSAKICQFSNLNYDFLWVEFEAVKGANSIIHKWNWRFWPIFGPKQKDGSDICWFWIQSVNAKHGAGVYKSLILTAWTSEDQRETSAKLKPGLLKIRFSNFQLPPSAALPCRPSIISQILLLKRPILVGFFHGKLCLPHSLVPFLSLDRPLHNG